MVIPTKNEAHQLGDCLDTLARQAYPRDRVEVVVVDARSTDGTREVARRHGALVVDDEGIGAADARNRGIAAATGDVVAFTDADCVPSPAWIPALVDRFERDPLVAGVGGAIRIRDDGNVWSLVEDVIAQANYRGFITSNVAYRRDVLLAVKGFNPLIRCGEDWDLWWRVLDEGQRVVYEPQAVVVHAPTEQRAARPFLEKQLWYARHDVTTWARRVLRTASRLRRGERAVLAQPAAVMRQTVANATMAALLLAMPWSRAAGAAGLALTAVWIAERVRSARGILAPADTPRFAAAVAVKGLVRGAGNLAGLAETLWRMPRVRPETRAFRPGLTRRAGAPREPAAPPPAGARHPSGA